MWIDPLGLSCGSDAKALRNSMEAAGKIVPGYKNSAHHIVMSNSKDPRMITLRNKMNDLGIKTNSAENGVFLPISSTIKNNVGTNAIAHSTVHTTNYKQNVFDRLKDISNKADFEIELDKIARELSNSTFVH